MSQYKSTTPPKGELRSPVTRTIVSYLEANGPSHQASINSALALLDGYGPCADPKRLGRVLHKLREAGHIHRVLRDDAMLWVHGPRTNQADAVAEQAAAPDPVANVQSPRYGSMHAGRYVPDAGSALRPGALNFKRVASVGQRC